MQAALFFLPFLSLSARKAGNIGDLWWDIVGPAQLAVKAMGGMTGSVLPGTSISIGFDVLACCDLRPATCVLRAMCLCAMNGLAWPKKILPRGAELHSPADPQTFRLGSVGKRKQKRDWCGPAAPLDSAPAPKRPTASPVHQRRTNTSFNLGNKIREIAACCTRGTGAPLLPPAFGRRRW